MIKISQYDYDPKQDLIKQLSWGNDNANIEDFSKLLDILELRQKVLMKYQTTQHYEQKRYESLLRRLQSKILKYFKKAEELWIKTHKGQVSGLENKISGLESLKNQYPTGINKIGAGYKEAAHELATLIIEGGDFIPISDKQSFENTVSEIVAEKIVPGSKDDIVSKIDFHTLIILTLNEIKRKRLIAQSNLKLKTYIEKAEQSGDIKEQIVAFEQALNSVHNSGPLLQYLALDKFNRPIINAHEPFEAFLTYLSHMNDEQLELTDEDMEKIQRVASMKISYREAFLAKKPVDRGSNWIPVYDNAPVWSKKFSSLKNTKNEDIIYFQNWAALRMNGNVTPNSTSGNKILKENTYSNADGWVYYYLAEYDLILAVSSPYSKDMEATQKAQTYVKDCYDSQIFKDIEIDKL